MQFCHLISAVVTERWLCCEIHLAVLIHRSLLTKQILGRGDKFGFQNGGVSSSDVWETEAKTLHGDRVFFLCFVRFFGCSLHYLCFSPGTYLVVSSLFNFCNEMRGSSVPVFSEPESKTLGRKGEKNHSVTSEKCWRPSYLSKKSNSQFLLTAIHFEIPTL